VGTLERPDARMIARAQGEGQEEEEATSSWLAVEGIGERQLDGVGGETRAALPQSQPAR
jgi:hypothetical protein